LPKKRVFASPAEKMLEEQAGSAESYSDMGNVACDLKLFAIPSMLFIRKVLSEITSTSAWGLVALCEAGPADGVLLSGGACANICTPANNRTGTNSRI
jgi:hypothetical protein